MNRIAADHGVYGIYARHSALSDYMEVRALKGRALSKSGLADLIADNGWQVRELFDAPGENGSDAAIQDESRDAADRVMSVLAERAEVLGDAYPFKVSQDLIEPKEGLDPLDDPYIALLAITVDHAYKLCDDPPAHEVFEALVAATFKGRVDLAVDFSKVRQEAGSFAAGLETAAAVIRLTGDVDRAWSSKYAKDENVDTIAHFHWGDARPGTWVFIGQVTVGSSDTWEQKIKEPSDSTWALYLDVKPRPQVFLAVPHHAETDHVHTLVQSTERVVLDRLRLVLFKGANSPDEKALIECLLEAPFDDD